jgi:UV DNA damage endonuclease
VQRLGLCCLFAKAPIRFRTTTAKHLSTRGEPLRYLSEIIRKNLSSLREAVDFCICHGIGDFRITSGLFPLYTHPQFGYQLEELPDSNELITSLAAIRAQAVQGDIRFTLHPDQFVVLSSPHRRVVDNSIAELEYHGLIAEHLGADVINIHGGGGYGDKPSALQRFAVNFSRLSYRVQSRLTVENDDKIYPPRDLLPLCRHLGIPFVYDVHHHRCLPDSLTLNEATEAALKTWNREPLFHLSSPKGGWGAKEIRLHADFIDICDVPAEWKEIDPLTVEIEAKSKELAVMQLREALVQQGWTLPADNAQLH